MFTVWLPALYPENTSLARKKDYFDTALDDALLLSANLAETFAHAAFSEDATIKQLATHSTTSWLRSGWHLYKYSTIRIIRSRLNNTSEILDRNLFLGMVTLARCEFMANNPHEGRVHLNACLELVNTRGGLFSLSDDELEVLCLDDLILSALSGKAPFTDLDEMQTAVQSRVNSAQPLPNWSDGFFAEFQAMCPYDSMIWDGIVNLWSATELINNSSCSEFQSSGCENLVLRGLLAGLQLCSSATEEVDYFTDSLYQRASFSECIRLAALLVIFTTHLKDTPKVHLLDRITSQLEWQLQRRQVSSFSSKTHSSIMLWINFLGAHGAQFPESKLFFLQGIVQYAQALGIQSWPESRNLLKRFPYIDKDYDSSFQDIWELAQFGQVMYQ